MAVVRKTEASVKFVDKTALLALLDRNDAANGHIRRKGMPAKELRALIITQGVNPDDNVASRELHRMKYGDEA